MTGCKKVFVDTAPFIYFIEKDDDNPQYYDKIKRFFGDGYYNGADFVSSVITVEEYLVFPYKIHSQEYVDLFERLIETLGMEIVVVDKKIAMEAAKIRAKYKSFKSMDALQLATAVVSGCDLFVTNDKQLRQFDGIKCLTLDEL